MTLEQRNIARPDERRYRTASFDPRVLENILGMGTYATTATEQIPDLRIIGSHYDPWLDVIEYLCWSSQFDIVKPGEMPPQWNPEYRAATE